MKSTIVVVKATRLVTIAPTLPNRFVNIPQRNGPRKTDAIAPHEIDNIVTITAGRRSARITDNIMKKVLAILMSVVRRLSEAFLLINPPYKSFVTVELEIRTNAASVDIEAESISRRISIDSDPGMAFVRRAGMRASKFGAPLVVNASGVFEGLMKTLVSTPVK
jgi:hypothetical protein